MCYLRNLNFSWINFSSEQPLTQKCISMKVIFIWNFLAITISSVDTLPSQGYFDTMFLLFLTLSISHSLFCQCMGVFVNKPLKQGDRLIIQVTALINLNFLFLPQQSLLDLKDRFDHFLHNSFNTDRLFKQAISSVSIWMVRYIRKK